MSGLAGLAATAAVKMRLVPPWVYKVAGGLLLVIGLLLWHHSAVHKHDTKIIAAEDQRFIAKINKITTRINALTTKIALREREAHEKEVARIDTDTRDIIVRGPGKAQCASVAPPASTRRSQPSNRSGDAPVDQVPNQGGVALIALPFNDAIRFAGQCDINRDEVLKWRENRQQTEEINGNFHRDN